jgi:hypothetical protein
VSYSYYLPGLLHFNDNSMCENCVITRPDDRTTLKGKVNSDGNVAGSLRQRVADFLQLIVCAEVNCLVLSIE